MTENCPDLTQGSGKLTFSSESLSITTDINNIDEKESLLTFPFDHMYACSSDNSNLNIDNTTGKSEVREVKDLLLLHLDLIQEQSEQIVSKDKQIATLKKDNEMLRQRIERMERRMASRKNHIHNSPHSNNIDNENINHNISQETAFNNLYSDPKSDFQLFDFPDTQLPESSLEIYNSEQNQTDIHSSCVDQVTNKLPIEKNTNRRNRLHRSRSPLTHSKLREELTKPIQPKSTKKNSENSSTTTSTCVNSKHSGESAMMVNNNTQGSLGLNKKTQDKQIHNNSRLQNNTRKRFYSESSIISNNSLASGSDLKKRKVQIKRESVMATDMLYFTQQGEQKSIFGPEEPAEDSTESIGQITLEVPRWREKIFTSCYTMEGTENLDDDVFNKRHLRLENDERRRKRWDVQRIREQRHIEKLKQRQERSSLGTRPDEQTDGPNSLWPTLDDIKYIEVTEEIPVSAFGFPIAQFHPREFSLPWFNCGTTVPVKKSPTKKTPARRKLTKR